jgi:hypothetical protein
MDENLGYSLTFWTIFAPFSKIEKVAENGRKVKAIALLFGRFSPYFQKSKQWLKMVEKLRLQPYFFAVFCPFMKNGKSC